ncbi:hypothetical protein BP6252_01196 [Coleophoma cylindrospora]|uniref:Reverse transcriptase domain-containing protein n=1 Tax=Coleophoma cylindrospora TaxID=1849047 RepID=A0A3D8SSF6_9HELO|nr:hypothetical protein BP6252_01196 [Coleophoma cylindrospora]
MSTAALSQTLKSITILKLKELEKQRKAYELRKAETLRYANLPDVDQRQRVYHLLLAVEQLDPAPASDIDLCNVRRWLDQSNFDTSVPDTMVDEFEKQLRSQLDIQTRRLDLANLYSQLLTEWLNPINVDESIAVEDDSSLDGSFELVDKDRLKQLVEKFEDVVFSPLDTDEVAIYNYLAALFEGDEPKALLERLRSQVKLQCDFWLHRKLPFDENTIQWCLKGLLGNDLLSDEKKAILQDFLTDEVARSEICDVLNMKYRDIKNWTWDTESGMPVQPRRQLNGKYRIMMDEDVLQAIFLHCIGMSWSSWTKKTLSDTFLRKSIWKHKMDIPRKVRDRRRYYLGEYEGRTQHGIEEIRHTIYKKDFFLSQLPSSVYEGAGGYDDDEEELSDDNTEERKSPKEIKQQLLRQIASEMHLRLAMEGEFAVVQSDFQWFGTSISHTTISAVLRFIGVSDEWIAFFKKFLEAPLNMAPVSDNSESSSARIRKRGVPMAHALEKFFGELVLFFMDFSVNQRAEMLLYRFHDDLWLCGQPEKCAKAWNVMEEFSAVMGLEFNQKKTGSVYISKDSTGGTKKRRFTDALPEGPVSVGLLMLHSSGEWMIDQAQVDAHVAQLQKQLSQCESILSWVQTWNSCIGRFFSHTFGEPAHCFGMSHVDRILETYRKMQETLFQGSNVTTHLKTIMKERFRIDDIPDAFIYLPEQLGGLGLLNPFISPFLFRDTVTPIPDARLRKAITQSRTDYNKAKRIFGFLSKQERHRRLRQLYPGEFDVANIADTELDRFFSYEEFVQYDESINPDLAYAYKDLMTLPVKKDIIMSRRITEAVDTIAVIQPELNQATLSSEIKWILTFYERELFERCGGLSIIEKNLLPLGILKILRKRRVAWQMVL